MDIEVPPGVGRFIENHLMSTGPNIIFGQDKHTSRLSGTNLAVFYADLAHRYDLQVVGVETREEYEIPSRKRSKYLPEIIRGIRSESINPDTSFDHYSGLMVFAAVNLGRRLVFADSGLDKQLAIYSNLYELYATEPSVQQAIPLSQFSETARRILLELPSDIQQEVAPAIVSFYEDQTMHGLTILTKTLDFIRTREAVNGLTTKMSEEQVSLGYLCRGRDHTDEFRLLALQNGIGYALFEPDGINKRDLLATARWEASSLKAINDITQPH